MSEERGNEQFKQRWKSALTRFNRRRKSRMLALDARARITDAYANIANAIVPIWLAQANVLAEIVRIQRKLENYLVDSSLGLMRIK
jgi:hypothetical protein